MDDKNIIKERLEKLNELKLVLSGIDDKLLLLTKELNWDHKKLLEGKASNMVTCSINPQHRVPITKIVSHEQKCSLHCQGYRDTDKFFSEYSGAGSSVTLTPETLNSITKNVFSSSAGCFSASLCIYNDGTKIESLCQNSSDSGDKLRDVPQTSANFDQNFNREEKLAIYNYVIENTQKQKLYSDLWLQPTEKREEKKEMSAWEIAAAERDAKRRRASYRNKVHTNRKTHTEILREVIDAQMEAFKEDRNEKTHEQMERHKGDRKKSSQELKDTYDKHKSRYRETSSRGTKEDKRRSHEKHSKHRDHKRSTPDAGSDIKSRSRSHDKYRKWKSYEGRSHSHRSSHAHRR